MVVPTFGYSINGFVAVGALAWRLFKATKNAPNSFCKIHLGVLSLHAVLKEAEENVYRSPLSPERQIRLKTIGDGCHSVLFDLQSFIDKYESLGSQSKRT